MKKLLLILVSLFMSLPVMAVPMRIAPNLYLVKTEVTPDAVITCFAHMNNEKAKLNGKVFTLEYACLFNEGGVVELGDSYFYYDWDYKNYIKGKNYYMSRNSVVDIIFRYDDGGI